MHISTQKLVQPGSSAGAVVIYGNLACAKDSPMLVGAAVCTARTSKRTRSATVSDSHGKQRKGDPVGVLWVGSAYTGVCRALCAFPPSAACCIAT